jgi:predicted phage-related endonuclease
MIVAGTTDLIGFEKDQTPFIADYKCMETIHKESVAWQLSLYDYFARKLEDNMLNGKKFFWKGAKKFIVFQCYDDILKPIELEPIADTEIERLLQAEYENKKYQRPLLVIDSELKERYNKAELMLVTIEQNYERAKAEAQELRNILLAEMEKQGIMSFETDNIKLTYIPQVERVSVDSGKLKKLYPQVYGNCTKITKVKPSLRIKVKELEDEI